MQPLEEIIGGAFCKVSFEEFNINSHTQVKDYLLKNGWVPTQYTEKGSPQLTEDSYSTIKDGVGTLLARRAVLKHRANMLFNLTKDDELKGLINLMRSDGRIEGGAITNATNTGRMVHRGIVNIPKPKDGKNYGLPIEIRSLFIAPKGKVLVGIDADALEARMEAHCCLPYKGGEEYASDLIEGDIHTKMALRMGIMTQEEFDWFFPRRTGVIEIKEEERPRYKQLEAKRDFAKSPKYALTYGAQPPKLAKTLGVSLKEGESISRLFWRSNTALSGFKEAITEAWSSRKKKLKLGSFVKGIDGRKIHVRSPHSIVNAYFQSTGSIVVKTAAVIADKEFRKRGLSAQQVIIYHDELQIECPLEEVEEVKGILTNAFIEAGKALGIRVPVTGSPKVGMNWMETH